MNEIRCLVQKQCPLGWFDFSELFFYLPAAEAALKRFEEDLPNNRFRLASLEWGDE